MNFNAKFDITQSILGYVIKPIEITLNTIIDTIRNLGISIHYLVINIDWFPFQSLPVLTWWEDLLSTL